MILLNSLSFNGKRYELNDSKGFMFPERDYKLPVGFYGGRVDKLAKTDVKGLYMCLEGMKPIDLIILDPRDLTKANIEFVLDAKRIARPQKANREELLKLLR